MKKVRKLRSDFESVKKSASLFANMLVNDNISVIFKKGPSSAPASFDIVKKTIYISPLKEHHYHLINGLVIHECGHAIHTNIHPKVIDKYPIFMVFNIIEDGYLERKMCLKYPGAKSELKLVFDEFFSPSKVTSANKGVYLANVLNYNCKGIKFGERIEYPDFCEDDDKKELQDAELCVESDVYKRWEYSKKIEAILKKYGDMPEDKPDSQGSSGSDSNSDSDSGDESDKSFDDILEESGDFMDHHKEFDIDDSKDNSDQPDLTSAREFTDRKSIKDIRDVKISATYLDDYSEFINECRIVANKMFSEFMTRSTALEAAMSMPVDTGLIDQNTLYRYRIDDDIFLSANPEITEESHSVVLLLDWSGSMGDHADNLIRKTCELIKFAELSSVDLTVYFYTGWKYNNFLLAHSPDFSAQEVLNSLPKLYTLSQGDQNFFDMSGTNILEAMVLGYDSIIKSPKSKKSMILMTDGCDSSGQASMYGTSVDRMAAKKVLVQSHPDIENVCVLWETYGNLNSAYANIFNNVIVQQMDSGPTDNAFIKQLISIIS